MVELYSIGESVLPPGTCVDEPDRGTRRTRNLNRSRSFDNIQNRHDSSLACDTDTLAVSLVLSQLDEEKYMECLMDDSDSLMQKQLLARSLPWYNLKAPLLRNLPRDIEDMKHVWFASDWGDGDLFRSHVNAGPHGFGMFDMNGLRIDSKGSVNDNHSPSCHAVDPTRDLYNPNTTPSPLKRRRESSSDSASNGSPCPSKRHHFLSSEYNSNGLDDGHIPLFSQSQHMYSASARRSVDPGVIELAVALPLPSLDLALLGSKISGVIPSYSSVQNDELSLQRATNILMAERAESSSTMPVYWHKIDRQKYENPPAFFDLRNLQAEFKSDDFGRITKEIFHENMSRREDRKRLFEELSTKCIRKWDVSVKVVGVSSRSSIDSKSAPYPLYCIATFPSSIQSGQTLTVESAIAKDEDGTRDYLGSYDCRSTATNPLMSFESMMEYSRNNESSENSSNRSRRINVGRTRLIWTGFQRISSTKINFSSLLSGQKLDPSSYKRPRDARVLIRLNGGILSSEKPTREQDGDPKWGKDRIRSAIASVYSQSPVGTSHIISPDYSPTSFAYCMFDGEHYLKSIRENIIRKGGTSKTKKKHIKQGSCILSDSIQDSYFSLKTGVSEAVKYRRPIFKCLPSEESFLRVICTEVGALNGVNINDYFNDAGKVTTGCKLCTICWTGSDPYEVLECVTCGLLVHEDCTISRGQKIKNDNDPNYLWKCSSCSTKTSETTKHEERKSQRVFKLPDRFKDSSEVNSSGLPHLKRAIPSSKMCCFCPHYGGSMSTIGSEIPPKITWAHDVCKIWGSQKVVDVKGDGLCCCLCGSRARTSDTKEIDKTDGPIQTHEPHSYVINQITGLARCAAVGCQVLFHPTCAMLVTRLRSNRPNMNVSGDYKEEKKKDIELCQEYTLSLTQIRRLENESLTNEIGKEKSYILPIAFCGFHNPSRDDSFYGCPPCADGVSDFIRIPYQHHRVDD